MYLFPGHPPGVPLERVVGLAGPGDVVVVGDDLLDQEAVERLDEVGRLFKREELPKFCIIK